MNKEQLIAKCKEIEPDWDYFLVDEELKIVNERYGSFYANKDMLDRLGSCEEEYEFVEEKIAFIPKILTLAQQYFKENDNG